MTGLSVESNDKCDNLKGVAMKYKHFDDIKPNHRMDFIMVYFAASRSLRELEAAIRRTNNGRLTCRPAWLYFMVLDGGCRRGGLNADHGLVEI